MAEFETSHYKTIAQYLTNKPHPAKKVAVRISTLRKEAQQYLAEKKLLEYKLNYILQLYPNIEDIFDDGFNDENIPELETKETTDRTRLFLSHEEYLSLSSTEKNQLALDRYLQQRKSKWQIGRDYEMYIGYLFEREGYSVQYSGIMKKARKVLSFLAFFVNNRVSFKEPHPVSDVCMNYLHTTRAML